MAGALGTIDIGEIMPVLQAALKAQPTQAGTDPAAQTDEAPALGAIGTPPSAGALGAITDARPQMPQSILGSLVPEGEKIPDKQMGLAEKANEGDKHAQGKIQYMEGLHDLESERDALDLAKKNNGFGMMPLTPGEWEAKQGEIDARIAHYKMNHPYGADVSAHPGVLGKILHGLSVVGQAGAAALLPGGAAVESMIPGSQFDLQAKEEGALGRIQAGTDAEAKEAAANAKDEKGDEWTHSGPPMVSDDGQILQPEVSKKGEFRMVPAGGGTPTVQAPSAAPTAGALGTVQAPAGALGAVPTKTAAQPGAPKFTKLGQVPKEEDQPAPASAVQDVNAALESPYLNDKQKKDMAFPEGYTPTKGEVKERLARIDRMNEYARQGKQDEFNNEMKRMQAQTQQQLAKLNIEQKEQKVEEGKKAATVALDNDHYNLYDQQQYANDVDAWHKSGNFGADSGLVAQQLSHEQHGGGGASLGLGLIAKTPATAIGAAGAETVLSQMSDIMSGYKDTLVKAGISEEGQQAIQAYTQAVLSRIQFDMSHLGAKASTMRMRELMRLAVQNVPPPNLQEKDFKNRFGEYYARMEGQIKQNVPKQGYTPPPNPYQGVNEQREQKSKDELPSSAEYRHDTFGTNTFEGYPKGSVPVYDRNKGWIGYATAEQEKQGKYTPKQ